MTAMLFRSVTHQEANLFLPIIKEHIDKIHLLVVQGQILHQKILGQQGQVDVSGGVQQSEDVTDWQAEMTQIEEVIRTEMLEIQQYGALVKNLFPARVDFRAERHKQPVYLCWQTGDDSVNHWHPVEEHFTMRRPIKDPSEFGQAVIH